MSPPGPMLERIDSARARVIEIIERWLPEGMPTEIGVAIAVTALATLFFVFFWRAVRYMFGLFTMKVAALEGTRLRPFRFQSEVLLSTRDMIDFAARLLHWLGTAVILIGFYIYLQTILGQFAATQNLAQRLVGYGIGAIELVFWSIVLFIPDLFLILVILFVARGAVSFAHLFFDGISRKRHYVKSPAYLG
jgi:hypothetical protein